MSTLIPVLHIHTLIIVCCHAIWLGSDDPQSRGDREEEWLIEPFQSGETPTFIRHIEEGVRRLQKEGGRAILVFSGGATKPALTPLSEAQSYLNLALARGLLDSTDALLNETVSLKDRMFLDEFATDSYQNVLFPLLQFPRYLQSLSLSPRQPLTPGRLIIVSHDFKRRRFTELHLPAIKFPVARTEYVGIDPVFDQDEDKGERRRRDITEGDLKRGFGAWKEDLYGDGEVLSAKRRVRGWSGVRMNDLLEQCASGKEGDKRREMIQRLLTWRGGDNRKEIFPERLPWEQDEVMARV